MSDLLKRLAEIEGIVGGVIVHKFWEGHPGVEEEWNPLENDAQALALVKKYKINIYSFDDGSYGASITSDDVEWAVEFALRNPDLNTAICMAIVESKQ